MNNFIEQEFSTLIAPFCLYKQSVTSKRVVSRMRSHSPLLSHVHLTLQVPSSKSLKIKTGVVHVIERIIELHAMTTKRCQLIIEIHWNSRCRLLRSSLNLFLDSALLINFLNEIARSMAIAEIQ